MSELQIFRSVSEFKRARPEMASVGFVPTMGALHQGHLSLMARALSENETAVVSIFVNPTQFNDPKDLANYPQPLEKDLDLLRETGVHAVLLPTSQEIYADGNRFALHERELSSVLCGPTRPGHFAGVLTVVMKLLNIVNPTRAYFGEKDYQQYLLIRDMARAFFLDSEIIGCATVRESDGLAMSSRNTLLTLTERALAPEIYQALTHSKSAADAERRLTERGFVVDYVSDYFGRRFAAARLGAVRLIDNVAL